MEFDEPPLSRRFAVAGDGTRNSGGVHSSGGAGSADSDPMSVALRILYPACLCLLNFCLAIAIWLCLRRPVRLLRMVRWARAWRAGLRFRTVRLDGTAYRLAEKGRPDPRRSSLLLIHSVADDCTAWTEFVGVLDPELDHVIAVDLPGHGGSQVSAREDFDPAPLAARVRAILAAAGLARQPVHAVGYSAGACVALAYAAVWPDQTELLTLAAPLLPPPPQLLPVDNRQSGDRDGRNRSGDGRGRSVDGGNRCGDGGSRCGDDRDMIGHGRDRSGDGEDSECRSAEELVRFFEDDSAFDSDLYNWLLPWDPERLPEALRHRTYRLVGGSGRMRRAWLADRLPRLAFHRALLANLTEGVNRVELLDRLAGQVRAPTQLVWGLHDEISPVSGVQLLQSRLTSVAQTDLMDECGHSIELDCPRALYSLVYKFRRNQSVKKLQ